MRPVVAGRHCSRRPRSRSAALITITSACRRSAAWAAARQGSWSSEPSFTPAGRLRQPRRRRLPASHQNRSIYVYIYFLWAFFGWSKIVVLSSFFLYQCILRQLTLSRSHALSANPLQQLLSDLCYIYANHYRRHSQAVENKTFAAENKLFSTVLDLFLAVPGR